MPVRSSNGSAPRSGSSAFSANSRAAGYKPRHQGKGRS
jgi:hypothetical protein